MSTLQHYSSAAGVCRGSGAALTAQGTIGVYHGNRSRATGHGACSAVENESNSDDSDNEPVVLGIYESEEEE
jgi:hypothetical protein